MPVLRQFRAMGAFCPKGAAEGLSSRYQRFACESAHKSRFVEAPTSEPAAPHSKNCDSRPPTLPAIR